MTLASFTTLQCRRDQVSPFQRSQPAGFCGVFPEVKLGQTTYFCQGLSVTREPGANCVSYSTQWSLIAGGLNNRKMRLSDVPVFSGREYVLGRGWYDPAKTFKYVIATALSKDVECTGYQKSGKDTPGWYDSVRGKEVRSAVEGIIKTAASSPDLALICLMVWCDDFEQRAIITCQAETEYTIVAGFADIPGPWQYARVPIINVADTGGSVVCGSAYNVPGWGTSLIVRSR